MTNDLAGIRVGKSLRVSAWPSMAAGSKNEAHRNGHFMGQSKSNESLSSVAEIKSEHMGRTFFNVGDHMLSYWENNGKHFVAWVAKFWDKGLVNSVGQREEFLSEQQALKFIAEKAKFFIENPLKKLSNPH